MATFNKVLYMGNLTGEVTVRPVGTSSVANFTLATSRTINKKDGTQEKETCFIDIEAWGNTATMAQQHLSKGKCALVEGRLKFSSWEDKTGAVRSKHVIFCENLSIPSSLDRSGEQMDQVQPKVRAASQSAAAPKPAAAPQTQVSQPANAKTQWAAPLEEIDELPF